ncbi:MAG: hypothetical protein J6Y37_13990 [Paludibacteraceae bacterium]|nr:hypothetical protein [Paludibacteraceae bacterium]
MADYYYPVLLTPNHNGYDTSSVPEHMGRFIFLLATGTTSANCTSMMNGTGTAIQVAVTPGVQRTVYVKSTSSPPIYMGCILMSAGSYETLSPVTATTATTTSLHPVLTTAGIRNRCLTTEFLENMDGKYAKYTQKNFGDAWAGINYDYATPSNASNNYLSYYIGSTLMSTTSKQYITCENVVFQDGPIGFYDEIPSPTYTWSVGTASPAVIVTNTVPGVSCTLQYLYIAVGDSTACNTTLINLKNQPTTVAVGGSISVPMTRVTTTAQNVRYVKAYVSGYFNGQPTNYYRLRVTIGPHTIQSGSLTNAYSFGMNEFTQATMDFTLQATNVYLQFASS